VRDVLVVGGGPAGLAVAAEAARRGLDALVVERRALPADKACGEGLLPRGVAALEALGALRHLDPAGAMAFRSVRWISEDGTLAEAALPPPHGLGVRRLTLSSALAARAREAGAEVRELVAVVDHRVEPEAAVVRLSTGEEVRARLLVAADGLSSPVREREGLGRPAPAPRRFGLRRHVAVAPWADAVEVHFAEGVEAYVTPTGPGRVGVAFLFEERSAASYEELLSRFPRLEARLATADFEPGIAGAGPLRRRAAARTAARLVLAGDAGGYADAITGEGLSLALEGARLLGAALPDALARGATREALAGFERALGARYRRYALSSGLVLALARRPALRRRAVSFLSRRPRLFGRLVGAVVGEGGPSGTARLAAVRG